MSQWLKQFERHTWDPYGFGYACAYTGGRPWPITSSGLSRGLLHATITQGLPGYGGGKMNPNFTVDPWTKRRWQHVPANIAARATAANNHQYVQIEIVGYLGGEYARKYGHDLTSMPDDALAYIAESLSIIGAHNGIPTSSGVHWLPYPASYGNNGVRLSTSQLWKYSGWLGHEHAPAPDNHGDPGAWPTKRDLFRAMTGGGGGGSHAPVKPPKTHKPAKPGKLTVDGCAGTATTDALEWISGNHNPDGHFSGQSDAVRKMSDVMFETFAACWPTMQWRARSKASGSRAIAWLQGQIGVKADGVMGPKTIRKLQKFLGVKVDGLPGPATVKALQRWINKKLGY